MPAAALVLLMLPMVQGANVSPLTTGTRIRVTAREAAGTQRIVVGPLRTFDSQALTVSSDAPSGYDTLARASITRLEISRGRRGHARTGLLLGAVLGLAAVALRDLGCEPDCGEDKPSGGFIAAAVGGGALLGAGIGAVVRSERWEPLPWAVGPARRAQVQPVASPAGLGLRVSLRF